MLAVFCLRLACGLAGCLLLLSPDQVAPRFYRTQFLTVLGLTVLAAVFLFPDADGLSRVLLVAGPVLAFVGSFVWSLEGAPLGRTTIVLATVVPATVLALIAWEQCQAPQPLTMNALTLPYPFPFGWKLADDLTSAALLGAATSAMLMGHSYLVAPAMSITPLMRLLGGLLVATLLRMAIAGLGLTLWLGWRGFSSAQADMILWLPLRWGLGFAGPLVLGWMAWQAARIRSTQSATGILYVVVIFCFLGELTSQLLAQTGFLL